VESWPENDVSDFPDGHFQGRDQAIGIKPSGLSDFHQVVKYETGQI
jgi:hypothetical protein